MRTLLCFALLLTASAGATEPDNTDSPKNRLIIPDIKVDQQKSEPGNVIYQNKGQPISGFQFDLRYNTEAFKVTPSIGASSTNAGKLLNANVLDDGTLRVIVVGFNQTLIEDGVVVVLTVEALDGAKDRSYKLNVSNVVGTTPEAVAVPIKGKDGMVSIRPNRDGDSN